MPAYHFFAVCPRTLEPILANELKALGAQQIKELFPETILIFIMAPSMSEVKKRIKT